MMDDIVGDYADKTVTLEDFPFLDAGVKMASVHPCRHASVMKVLLDRADAALKLRRHRQSEAAAAAKKSAGIEGLVDDLNAAALNSNTSKGFAGGVAAAGGNAGDEWEVLQQQQQEEDEVAVRVDQYLVVFVKFLSTMTPSIEHDYTMGI
ncbi:MAG: hypothetical protein LQ341_007826 [Variospora aurantia]|nr:MAG: hypothetical protein LQ341_007826 [Variospora aurantia]